MEGIVLKGTQEARNRSARAVARAERTRCENKCRYVGVGSEAIGRRFVHTPDEETTDICPTMCHLGTIDVVRRDTQRTTFIVPQHLK